MNPAANAGVSVGLGMAFVHILAWLVGLTGASVPENIQGDMAVVVTVSFGYLFHTRGLAIAAAAARTASTVATAAADNAKVSTILLVLLAAAALPGCSSTPADPGQPAETQTLGSMGADLVIPVKGYPQRVYRVSVGLTVETVLVAQRAAGDKALAAQTLGLLNTAVALNKALRDEMKAAGPAGRPAWFELHIGQAATAMADVGIAVGMADVLDFSKLASFNPVEWVQFALGKIKEANTAYWMLTDLKAQLADIDARGGTPSDQDYAAIDALLAQAIADLGNAAKPVGAPSPVLPAAAVMPPPLAAPLPSVAQAVLP